ncbi:MAG: cell division protein FtsQ [Saprospiraceae bacterium]|nr:cell division protein FtsQ [Saprospiraceae bacterium]
MNRKELNKMLIRIAWVAALFGAAVLVISAVEKKEASLTNEILMDIRPLQNGNKLIDRQDVLTTIDRSFGFKMEGLSLGEVDVARLERILEEDPFILNADVYVDAKNNINIGIDQREPIIRIIDHNGLNYYLDIEGKKLPLSKHFSARVLVATGNIPPYTLSFQKRKKHRLKDLFELSQLILNDPFLKALVEHVHVTNQGEYVLIPKIGKQKIYLGRFSNVPDKLDNLKIFYQEGMTREGWSKYVALDIRYKGQVVGIK